MLCSFLSQQLKELNVAPNSIPLLNEDQSELKYSLEIDHSGPYVLLIEYVTPVSRSAAPEDYSNETTIFSPKWSVAVRFQSGDAPESIAIVNLNDCPYTAACRQVVVDDVAKIFVVNVESPENTVYLNVSMFLFQYK